MKKGESARTAMELDYLIKTLSETILEFYNISSTSFPVTIYFVQLLMNLYIFLS